MSDEMEAKLLSSDFTSLELWRRTFNEKMKNGEVEAYGRGIDGKAIR